MTQNTSEIYVYAQGLTRRFEEQIAVNQVSFQIARGEVVGFLGPNGAGKTTTMRMLVGYLLPDQGYSQILGYDSVRDVDEVRRHVGYLPENNPLYVDMYVREFLLYMARLYRLAKPEQRVRTVIEQVGLTREAHKRIRALSRGYRQRVGLAHALLHNPEVFILDEPTSGLDPVQVQEIRALIRELGKEHTIILSTHILQEVEQICTRVLIIHRGRLIADAPLQELRRLPGRLPVVRVRFRLAQSQALEKIATQIAQSIPEVQHVELVPEQHMLRLTGNDADQIAEQVFWFASQRHLPLVELTSEEHPLEEVFQILTREASRESSHEITSSVHA